MQPPLISVVMPVFNTDPRWLKCALDSFCAQTYAARELCVADDCSTRRDTVDFLKGARRSGMKMVFLDGNRGISGATNAAVGLASGEYLAFLDHDDELAPDMLEAAAGVIAETGAEFIYADEELIDENGRAFRCHRKPDYRPELLFTYNYITHPVIARKSLVDAVGGLDSAYDGAQDYDLALKLTETAAGIVHIPRVLYRWRMLSTSAHHTAGTREMADRAGRAAVEQALRRRGISGHAVHAERPFRYRVVRPVDETGRAINF